MNIEKHKKYNVIDMETGRLDPAIYADPDIYREEMEKVFGRSWLLIGHESLLPNAGDFFHTYMGEQPVILTRDSRGGINALLNICRHRGARLVRTDDGNCNSFMCTYHAWTYGLDGTLEYVPGEEEAYYGELDKSKFGLHRARVATYAGLIFATWDHEAPSLEDFLGDMRWYLDMEFNRSAKGTIALGPHKWVLPVNWKTAVDNCSDWYHVPTSHASSINALARTMGRPRLNHEKNWGRKGRHAFVNGHQAQFFVVPDDFEERKKVTPESIDRLGKFRAAQLALGTHSLFPNTVLGFRLAIPRGPLKTEFWHFAVVDADATPEEQREDARQHTAQNGVAGHFEADDVDNWRQVSESGLYPGARGMGQYLNMSVEHSHYDDTYPGLISDRFVSEQNQRNFYHRWEQFMNADSWADIPLDPMKATYEGTAGMA